MPEFDKAYWEDHWAPSGGDRELPANPYLAGETAHLPPATALDAGCGTGAEAVLLAERGWRVTGVDISHAAIAAAQHRAERAGVSDRIEWLERDLTRWEPDRSWDLVVTSYAHSEHGQFALYRKLASLVAPGGTILIIGHLHDTEPHGHAGAHPETATVTRAAITQIFDVPEWTIDAGYEHDRLVDTGTRSVPLRDVVVRARRNG